MSAGHDAAADPGARRVLSVPAHHDYVDAVRPVIARPVHPERTTGWQQDPYLRPEVAAAWAEDIDVVHLHFGYDHLTGQDVRRWLDELERSRTPLVLTVHDLRNPHHETRRRHDALLAELVPAAAAVLTLTSGAALEIAQRHGRLCLVVPHPTVLRRPADGVDTEQGLVTIHLKSLRRNLVDPVALVAAAAFGAKDGGGRLRVDLHPDVVDDERLRGLHELSKVAGVEVVIHERFDDVELSRYLARSHVTVLPHRWGTHSGWLELARDLGTRVVAPTCGYYRDQWDEVVTYTNDEGSGLDVISLRQAVAIALSDPAPRSADRRERLREAAEVRRTHAEIYTRVSPVSRHSLRGRG